MSQSQYYVTHYFNAQNAGSFMAVSFDRPDCCPCHRLLTDKAYKTLIRSILENTNRS